MGVKYLNNFIMKNCKNSLKYLSFNDLKDKVIVVDTSIYLYRFKSENILIKGFYELITKFKLNNIIPIFIFDGKPINEKNSLLQIRKNNKLKAKNKYYKLKSKIKDNNSEETIKLNKELLKLEKKCISITKQDIFNVKCLLRHMNIYYYNAPFESDSICAKFVINNIAYACLSDDMDLFVYGCTRVLRYLNVSNSTFVLYDYKKILKSLKINDKNFKKICILSGTDYNINNNNISLYKGYKLYNMYKYSNYKNYTKWLVDNNIINNKHCINNVINIFNIDDINMDKYTRIYSNKKNNADLEIFLEKF